MSAKTQTKMDPAQKAGLVQVLAQMDMLVLMFADKAPDRVKNAAKEFRDALQEWHDAG